MTRKQQNFMHMVGVTLEILTKHNATLAGLAPLTDAISRTRALTADVHAALSEQRSGLLGFAKDKAMLKAAAVTIAAKIAALGYAWAVEHADAKFAERIRIRRSTMTKCAGTALTGMLAGIQRQVLLIPPEGLAAYGITAALLKQLDDSTAAYNAEEDLPQAAICQRKTITGEIASGIVALRAELKLIDYLISAFDEHTDLIADYRNARAIVDRHGSPGRFAA